jgi:Tol biopolymer transport system component
MIGVAQILGPNETMGRFEDLSGARDATCDTEMHLIGSSKRFAKTLSRATVVVGVLTTFATAQETSRVSVDSSGGDADWGSYFASISTDGRFVAFVSDATNLVSGDVNGVMDVFVRDRSTGTIERVNVDSSGAEANADCLYDLCAPSISADGRFVAFNSWASKLVVGDGNYWDDVFIHDRATGMTERVSVDLAGGDPNSTSLSPAISSDGRFVAFVSYADNLVVGDMNGIDVFVRDWSAGVTERVSVDSSGIEADDDSFLPAISADGRFIAFTSRATNLVAGDTNGTYDVFVHDRSTGTTERVSVDASGAEGDARSGTSAVSISADGRLVAFDSDATNLVAGDTNRNPDVFVHDRSTGTTERVSVDSSGREGDGWSYYPALSEDGTVVAFNSDSTNLVVGDANGTWDTFVHDRRSGITRRVSIDSSGAEGNYTYGWYPPSVSAGGVCIAFASLASNLVANDTNADWDVFVHELCSIDATWSNYGAGFPGTHGVPAFTSRSFPAFGSTVTLDLENSYSYPTIGLIFCGFEPLSFRTKWGGDLLVLPSCIVATSFSHGGNSYSFDIPIDYELCGATIELQAIEADPGAAKGVSFTQGLELILGQ